MSTLKEWIDECFSKELKDVPHKPKGAINVVVYDKTNVPPPGAVTLGDRVKSVIDPHQSLTFWWKLGSFIDQLQAFADYSVGAASWEEAFNGVNDAVSREAKKTGQPVTIASLQFWGHGSSGHAYMGDGTSLSKKTLAPGGTFHDLAVKTASHLHRTQGHVWFRCCTPFQGTAGQDFARAASAIFVVPVIGHTFIIHALQSGTEVLLPGAQPNWDTDEGIHKRGKHKSDDIISSPWRRRTVTMFRLYPPLDPGDIVLPSGLLGAIERGISRITDDDE
jgi:hypothetical protein